MPKITLVAISAREYPVAFDKNGTVLEELPLPVYQSFSELFEQDVSQDIDLKTCVEKRTSEGGTSAASVEAQIAYVKESLKG